jgi:hypothetical protein
MDAYRLFDGFDNELQQAYEVAAKPNRDFRLSRFQPTACHHAFTMGVAVASSS